MAKILQMPPPPPSRPSRRRGRPRVPAWPIGLAGLILSAAALLILVIAHFKAMDIPGCGLGGGCEEAAASAWGAVPVVGWPVSFLGLAYFSAAGAAWAVSRGRLADWAIWVIRAGAVVSILYVAVMIAGGYFCLYCALAHVGNFVFLMAAEIARRGSEPLRALSIQAAGGVVFIAASVVLGLIDWQYGRAVAARAEKNLAESTAEIIAVTTQQAAADFSAQRSSTDDSPSPGGSKTNHASAAPGFTGRYRRGPSRAAIRIVAFTDYQCSVCARLDRVLEDLLLQRSDVSVSLKQFPACAECNERFTRRNIHPNACRAARAAEAAGIVGGDEGFYEMSRWLFARGGAFDYGELFKKVRDSGWDTGEFLALMDCDETLKRIQSDIAEALALGISFTPMVFINGVELRGGRADDAVSGAVEALAKRDLPPMTADADRPRPAAARFRELWRESPVTELPVDPDAWVLGPAKGLLEIVLWGDYQDDATADTDQAIRRLIAGRPDARYAYRHFPMNHSCNPAVPETTNLMACWAARAAEAAGLLKGSEGFWRMHEWLMRNHLTLMESALRTAAPEMGFDAKTLSRLMDDPRVLRAIADDVEAARETRLKNLPWVFVNGRRVSVFYADPMPVLKAILDEAAGLQE